jgi:enoyl-[acyl-carrier protein] reductase I
MMRMMAVSHRRLAALARLQRRHVATVSKKLALVMGVANQRSIAWACVESFLKNEYDCIITYYSPSVDDSSKYASKIEKLASTTSPNANALILGSLSCNVESDLPVLFRELLPSILNERKIDAVVHSIAHASEMDRPLLQTTRSAFLNAHNVSAYSFLETVRECVEGNILSDAAALTTLTYVGAIRAVPGYGSMGPAKAALESVVRGLALELGSQNVRINAVSAGPIKTVSARGIPNFGSIQQHVGSTAPLRRNVSADEVADTITWLSTAATGITGQTIYVDAGYSNIVPVSPYS